VASNAPAAEDSSARFSLPRRWLLEHARTLVATLGRLSREPVSTFLTAAVIGVTLALPAGLHVLVQNVSAMSYSWEGALQASLFLEDEVSTCLFIGAAVVFMYAVLGGMKGITYTQVAQYCVLISAYTIPAVFISLQLTGNPIPGLGLFSGQHLNGRCAGVLTAWQA